MFSVDSQLVEGAFTRSDPHSWTPTTTIQRAIRPTDSGRDTR
jgi:hypothetical protein